MDTLGIFILILFYAFGIVVVAGNVLAIAKCIDLPWIGDKLQKAIYLLQNSGYGKIIYYVLLAGICLTIPYVVGVLTAITAGIFSNS